MSKRDGREEPAEEAVVVHVHIDPGVSAGGFRQQSSVLDVERVLTRLDGHEAEVPRLARRQLRALLDDFTAGMKIGGDILFNNINVRTVRNVYALRSRIGVVFPLPVGLPLTIYDNVALAPRLRGIKEKAELDVIVERCLERAALWDEVKDRLNALGSLLSGGQQQRLTIARALSQEPEVLMLDEFSIAVDPVTTMRIEDVLKKLKQEMTIILVTNLVRQAHRLADRTAFFLDGKCIEIGDTESLFIGDVKDSKTKDYIEGRFG